MPRQHKRERDRRRLDREREQRRRVGAGTTCMRSSLSPPFEFHIHVTCLQYSLQRQISFYHYLYLKTQNSERFTATQRFMLDAKSQGTEGCKLWFAADCLTNDCFLFTLSCPPPPPSFPCSWQTKGRSIVIMPGVTHSEARGPKDSAHFGQQSSTSTNLEPHAGPTQAEILSTGNTSNCPLETIAIHPSGGGTTPRRPSSTANPNGTTFLAIDEELDRDNGDSGDVGRRYRERSNAVATLIEKVPDTIWQANAVVPRHRGMAHVYWALLLTGYAIYVVLVSKISHHVGRIWFRGIVDPRYG